MKTKIGTILNTGKKKIAAVVICCVLTLTIGTGVVFAANTGGKTSSSTDNGIKTISTEIGQVSSKDAPKGGSMMVQNENGSMRYSTDGGKTWTEGAPEGFNVTVNGDGSSTAIVGDPPKDGTSLSTSLMGQNINGTVRYSTDGGKTWSDKVPDGFTASVGKDGSFMVKGGK